MNIGREIIYNMSKDRDGGCLIVGKLGGLLKFPHRNLGKFSRLIHCQWKAQPDQKDPSRSSDQPQVAQEEPH